MTFFILVFRKHDVVRAFPSYSAQRCLGCSCNTKAQGMNPVLACLLHPPTLRDMRAPNPKNLGIFPPFSTDSTKCRLLNCGEGGLWCLCLCVLRPAPYGRQWQGCTGVHWACRWPVFFLLGFILSTDLSLKYLRYGIKVLFEHNRFHDIHTHNIYIWNKVFINSLPSQNSPLQTCTHIRSLQGSSSIKHSLPLSLHVSLLPKVDTCIFSYKCIY